MSITADTALLTYLQNAKIPTSFTKSFVQNYYPTITKTDIDNGYIVRYFAKQVNHASPTSIVEINSSTYSNLTENVLYQTISLQWRITGNLDDVPAPSGMNSPIVLLIGVKNGNIQATKQADVIMLGIAQQLPNPLQFYQGM